MMSGFKAFWYNFVPIKEESRTYRVAFVAPFSSPATEYYAHQVAGYVQLFTSGRLQPTFFYGLLTKEGQTQFAANLQVFPYDAVVCIGSATSSFLMNLFSENENLRTPTLSLAYRELNSASSLPGVRENSAPNHSEAQYRIISQLPTRRRHLLFCATKKGVSSVPAHRDLIALLRRSGLEVSPLIFDGKEDVKGVLAEKAASADLFFLSNELIVERAAEELIPLAQRHGLLTISARIAHMAYNVDCAIGFREESVCRRAAEVVACMVQGKPAEADIYRNLPLEFHVNPARFFAHKAALGKVGKLLGEEEVLVRLYTEQKGKEL
ncbi:MAG: hypothetical protein PVJ92_01845 [Candidatus Dependentiae bacterium]|jgi:hypothetical protein